MPCDYLEVARCLKNKSIELFDDGEKLSAFEVLTKAYEIVSKLPHTKNSKTLHIELADEFRRNIDNNEQALQHYQHALEFCITYFITHRELLTATHHNIAIAYQNLDNMDESRSHLQCALTAVTLRNGKYYTTEIKVLKALALSYEKPNKWASVAHFFQRILDLPLRHTPNHPIVSKIRNALSNAENKINKSLPTL
ncbi:unnamed protein product [Rotaria socialis]|uniref:Uncharacterized protein n=1 Tax=Rotaria socialis TaxID=392032 RepID=A0A821DVD3_9BILA|nr:unnamed protein product [Rotaria socialis]CAF4626929.1 unnamed protein product [Rotaria socialis]